MRRGIGIVLLGTLLLAAPASGQDAPAPEEEAAPAPVPAEVPDGPAGPVVNPPEPKSLSELLNLVRQGFDEEREENTPGGTHPGSSFHAPPPPYE